MPKHTIDDLKEKKGVKTTNCVFSLVLEDQKLIFKAFRYI
uniref:Uncharacterized protein n=1 Tax=Rhizophora mucronata TaxID=61149 RepID=A0A2P2NEA5_RHIMU